MSYFATINHAADLLGTRTERGAGRSIISTPRPKFTFLVEFNLSSHAIQMLSHLYLREALRNGRLLVSLKEISYPSHGYTIRTYNAYNKTVHVPVKTNISDGSMSFHDDAASIVSALMQEYHAFYSYAGDIGKYESPLDEPSEFHRYGSSTTGTIRKQQNTYPSLGMKIRPSASRHFFDSIVIYDLGSEPNSVNVHSFVYPVITQMSHDSYNYNDAGTMSYSITFQPENAFHFVGKDNSNFADIVEELLRAPLRTGTFAIGGVQDSNIPRVESISDVSSSQVGGGLPTILTPGLGGIIGVPDFLNMTFGGVVKDILSGQTGLVSSLPIIGSFTNVARTVDVFQEIINSPSSLLSDLPVGNVFGNLSDKIRGFAAGSGNPFSSLGKFF